MSVAVEIAINAGSNPGAVQSAQTKEFLLKCLKHAHTLDPDLHEDIADACEMNELTAFLLGSKQIGIKEAADKLFLMEDESTWVLNACRLECLRSGIIFGNETEEEKLAASNPAAPVKAVVVPKLVTTTKKTDIERTDVDSSPASCAITPPVVPSPLAQHLLNELDSPYLPAPHPSMSSRPASSDSNKPSTPSKASRINTDPLPQTPTAPQSPRIASTSGLPDPKSVPAEPFPSRPAATRPVPKPVSTQVAKPTNSTRTLAATAKPIAPNRALTNSQSTKMPITTKPTLRHSASISSRAQAEKAEKAKAEAAGMPGFKIFTPGENRGAYDAAAEPVVSAPANSRKPAAANGTTTPRTTYQPPARPANPPSRIVSAPPKYTVPPSSTTSSRLPSYARLTQTHKQRTKSDDSDDLAGIPGPIKSGSVALPVSVSKSSAARNSLTIRRSSTTSLTTTADAEVAAKRRTIKFDSNISASLLRPTAAFLAYTKAATGVPPPAPTLQHTLSSSNRDYLRQSSLRSSSNSLAGSISGDGDGSGTKRNATTAFKPFQLSGSERQLKAQERLSRMKEELERQESDKKPFKARPAPTSSR